MKVLSILGVGCEKCETLAANAAAAARALGIAYELVRVTEIEKMLEYDVLMTPALVVDGEVKCVGVVPSVEEIQQFLA
jgi:small redox-active disulfide protein 2